MPSFTRSGLPAATLRSSFLRSSPCMGFSSSIAPRVITASCSSTGLKVDIADSREELEAAGGLESMRDVLEGRFACRFRPREHEHVVAHRDLSQQAPAGQEARSRLGNLPLLAEVHRGGCL